MRLAGKTALITATACGIGLAFPQAYAAEGADVVLAEVDLPAAPEAAAAVVQTAPAVRMGETDSASIEAGLVASAAHVGQTEILINNAAIYTGAPNIKVTGAGYRSVFDTNLADPVFTLHTVARHMIERDIQGSIINTASHSGHCDEDLTGHGINVKASASDTAGYSVAQTYNVDGGNWMR
ncbi:MAG: SDR family NAD(P)-dependent oxidoreductase [Pseudomonadota bacterium]